MRISEDAEKLILQNLSLVRYFVIKIMGKSVYDTEFEDLLQVGTMGLIRAAMKFNPELGFKFSTLAIPSIRNEILVYIRKKELEAVSIDESQRNYKGEYDEKFSLINRLADPYSFVEDILDKDYFLYLVSIALNRLKKMERVAILYFIADIRDGQIGEKLGMSHQAVAVYRKKAISDIRNVIVYNLNIPETFTFEQRDKKYYFSVCIDTFEEFYHILLYLMDKEDSRVTLFFKNKRLILVLPEESESFEFLADMFYNVD